MKKSLIALAAMAAVGLAFDPKRASTHDVSFGYRMGAGFPGSVNRTHPVAVYPCMLDQTVGQVPVSYGIALVANTANNTYRQLVAADHSDATPLNIAGCLVRPWPVQSGSSAGAFGQQALTDVTAPVVTVPNDIMKSGRMMVQVNGAGAAALTINSDVYVWCAASGGGHILGGFEPAFSAGNTVKVANAKYRGPGDANNITEIEVIAAAA